MNSVKVDKAAIEGIVAGLFADNRSPMEHFGIEWAQIEMLERREPSVVIKLAPQEEKIAACGGIR
ncbi:hypothetical protein [Pragia fontium]|uniref:hypothetical protein n=1 Tax=Pragia fontium TaxID=82985 RepID=UPI000F6F5AD5|nr:hypothetical protein [Pragia fontium]VEJ54614.1 Uncharacterised protein [Pragia fontium]